MIWLCHLNGQNLVYYQATKAPFQFQGNLAYGVDVYLVIQKTVNSQYVSWFDNGVSKYFFFKEIHLRNLIYSGQRYKNNEEENIKLENTFLFRPFFFFFMRYSRKSGICYPYN